MVKTMLKVLKVCNMKFCNVTCIIYQPIVRTKNQKSRLVLMVQAFCEEKGLWSLSGVFGYAKSKNQCWQAEKWLFIDLICIFSRWPPKTMDLVLYC